MSRIFRIGVDARPLTAPMSGVARVIASVLRFFPDRECFHFVLYASRPWHSDFAEVINLPNVTWVQGDGWTASRAGLWFNFSLPVLLRQDPVDLFWGSQQVIPPGMSRGHPVLLTCYDLVSYFYPETMRPLARMQQRAVMRLSMRRADRILAISTQTRDDTIREFEYPPEKAGVALLGYEVPRVPVGEELEQLRGEVALRLGFRPKNNFILAVSTIEPRKNYGVLLDAYIDYYRRVGLRAFPLVIAGRRGWETPEFYRKMEDYQRECGRIYTLEGLSDRHLGELYRSCAFFCMPSAYEGFGLPPLEALCNGRLALASDIPCFHEIGGDAVTYLPADDVPAWSAALETATSATTPVAVKNKKPAMPPRVDFDVSQWGWDRTAAIYHTEFLRLLEKPAAPEIIEAIADEQAVGAESAPESGGDAPEIISDPTGAADAPAHDAGVPGDDSRPEPTASVADDVPAAGEIAPTRERVVKRKAASKKKAAFVTQGEDGPVVKKTRPAAGKKTKQQPAKKTPASSSKKSVKKTGK